MTSEEEYPFIFTKLTEKYEGDMINRLGRSKDSYIGKKCRQVGYYPPYVFEFEDGAKWALYAGQVTPVSMRYRVIEYGKDKPVICVETEERLRTTATIEEVFKYSRFIYPKLQRAGLKTMGELLNKTPHEVHRIKGFSKGSKGYYQLIEVLNNRGLQLKSE